MEFEEQMYMELLFEHYESFVLLFGKSDGSSVEKYLITIINRKVITTVDFLEKTAKQPVNRE